MRSDTPAGDVALTLLAGVPARWLAKTHWVLVSVALLIGSTFALPLWTTRMEAPQYKGDEALLVKVYAGRVTGDLKEIDVLNQYVGVHLPLEGAEIRLLPAVFGGLSLLALLAAVLSSRWHRRAIVGLATTLLVTGVAGLALLQYRLYQMGHERSEEVFAGVDDFTPPVLGSIHVANFDSTMALGAGGWLLLVAMLLCGATLIATRRPRDSSAVSRIGGAA